MRRRGREPLWTVPFQIVAVAGLLTWWMLFGVGYGLWLRWTEGPRPTRPTRSVPRPRPKTPEDAVRWYGDGTTG